MMLSTALCLIACHYWQEATCGHHPRYARWSLVAGAAGYAFYAANYALH